MKKRHRRNLDEHYILCLKAREVIFAACRIEATCYLNIKIEKRVSQVLHSLLDHILSYQ